MQGNSDILKKNQQMISEIQPINSESRDEQNLKTTPI